MILPHEVGDRSNPHRRLGIFAGVGQHDFDPSYSLRYADDDCRKLSDAFCHEQRFGFIAESMRILRSSAPRPADRPLRSVLLANLWDGLAGKKTDLLVLFLAMHGVELNGRTYLVPQDGIARHRETLISLGDLLTGMSRVDARQRLVIFDGCHGGGVGGRRLPASFASEIGDMPELTVLSACDIGEASYDCQELQGGVYTHYLAEALREEPIDADNRLPLSRAHERAERFTKEWAAQHGVVQSPRDFANRRTTINLFPPSGDVLPLPRRATNKKDRTGYIIEALRHILEHHRDRIGLGHFCIRIYARLSSFAVADDENWQHLDQEYFELVKEERDLLKELLAAGARVKLVLSWDATDLMQFRQVDLEKRLHQLYEFFDEVRRDHRLTARFSVVRTPIHDRNLLALDDLYVFIGRKLGLAGGLDVTQIIQDAAGVRDEIGFFDAVFDEAFRNLCTEEKLDSAKTDNAELLRLALLEIRAGLRILEKGRLAGRPEQP
jgi:hypothetical protein